MYSELAVIVSAPDEVSSNWLNWKLSGSALIAASALSWMLLSSTVDGRDHVDRIVDLALGPRR